MKGGLFQHEMTETSAVFGRESKINVVFRGNEAYTDGDTITVPSVDALADITDEQRDVMRGYIDHEAGHVRHTDFEYLNEWARKNKGNKLLTQTHNALEDIWLERRVMDDYPGATTNLRAVTSEVNQTFLDEVDATDERLKDPKFIGPVAITWEGRKSYGGETPEQCLDRLPDNIRNNLHKYIKALDACETTKDVCTLAEAVSKSFAEDWMDEFDEEQEQFGRPTKPCDDGEGGEGETTGEGDVPSGEPKGEGEGTAPNPTDGDKEGTGHSDEPSRTDGDKVTLSRDDREDRDHEGGGVGGGHEVITAEDPDEIEVYENFDLGDAVKRSFGEAIGKSRGAYKVFDSSQDKWHSRKGKTHLSRNLRNASPNKYAKELAEVSGSLNVMRRKLERALVATQTRDWEGGMENGRLDTRRLTSAYQAKPNVFKLREDRKEMDTALTMLIDLSGSMRRRRASIAQKVAIAVCEAIDRTGVKYEVLGFNNRSDLKLSSEDYDKYHSGDLDIYNFRCEPLDMYVFKDFDERLFEAKPSMGMIADCAGGNNSDGDAIIYAYQRLAQRIEKRKIFITLSDGWPACAMDSDLVNQYTRDAVNLVEKSGIDVIGIGIQSDAVSQFYPKWVEINDLDDLEGAVMDKLAQALLGTRFQVDNSKLFNASA